MIEGVCWLFFKRAQPYLLCVRLRLILRISAPAAHHGERMWLSSLLVRRVVEISYRRFGVLFCEQWYPEERLLLSAIVAKRF